MQLRFLADACELPRRDVRVRGVVAQRFAVRRLALLAEVPAARLPAVERVDFGSPDVRWKKDGRHFTYWKTDRGHIYISFGKPDSIDSHPSGGAYQRPIDEGGGETSTFPFETWHYRYLEGVGENIDLEFVDTCQCGDYHFTIDRGETSETTRDGVGAMRQSAKGDQEQR